METGIATKILALAKLGCSDINPATLLNFFWQFDIGRTPLGFNGVRLDKQDAPWICFSREDVERAKKLWNPPCDSEEFKAGMNDEELSADDLAAKLEAMFVDINVEPWAGKICQEMQRLSEDASKFLANIALQNKLLDDGNQLAFKNFLLPAMDAYFKKIIQGNHRCFELDTNEQPPRIVLNPYAVFSTLDDEIVAKFYLAPFLAGTSSLWMRTRVCEECQRLFFYKQKRARYCSQKCRMAVANRERRSKN